MHNLSQVNRKTCRERSCLSLWELWIASQLSSCESHEPCRVNTRARARFSIPYHLQFPIKHLNNFTKDSCNQSISDAYAVVTWQRAKDSTSSRQKNMLILIFSQFFYAAPHPEVGIQIYAGHFDLLFRKEQKRISQKITCWWREDLWKKIRSGQWKVK